MFEMVDAFFNPLLECAGGALRSNRLSPHDSSALRSPLCSPASAKSWMASNSSSGRERAAVVGVAARALVAEAARLKAKLAPLVQAQNILIRKNFRN